MPNLVVRQTAAGVNNATNDGASSDTMAPVLRRGLWAGIHRWWHRRAQNWRPPLGVVVAPQLQIQHTTAQGTGIVPIFTSANTAGADTYTQLNGQSVIVEIINNGSQTEIISITAVNVCSQGYLHNYSQSIPAGGTARIGPFDSHYLSGSGLVTITYSIYQQGVLIAVLAP